MIFSFQDCSPARFQQLNVLSSKDGVLAAGLPEVTGANNGNGGAGGTGAGAGSGNGNGSGGGATAGAGGANSGGSGSGSGGGSSQTCIGVAQASVVEWNSRVRDCGDGSGAHCVHVCHVPPGNPQNAHTIDVDINAVPAHLGHSTDYIGECRHQSEKPCDPSRTQHVAAEDCRS